MRSYTTVVGLSLAALLLAVHLAVSQAAPLWGDEGHQTVAYVATSLISSSTTNEVSNLLSGNSMVDVATWADQVRRAPGYTWTPPLHYIDTPDWACNYDHDRDCSDDMCVAGAITNYTNRLSTSQDQSVQNEALKFLIHFLGDIHQPLHVAFASDRGGNDIKVRFYGDSANLHEVWDTKLVVKREDTQGGSVNSYGDYLLSQISGPWSSQATQWAQCSQLECAVDWATETAGLACSNAYVMPGTKTVIQNGDDLTDDYYNGNAQVVDMQLAKGGVRLAALLDRIFNPSTHAIQVESLPSNAAIL